MRMVARCVRGLEPLLATEILRYELGTITHLGHREVRFRTEPSESELPESEATELRLADDVFQLTAEIPDIGPAKAGVHGLGRLAESIGVQSSVEGRSPVDVRSPIEVQSPVAGIEVTASFLGRRNFNRHDAEDAVGRILSERLGVPYHSRRNNSVPPSEYSAWRLALDGVNACLMRRIADHPLHRRPYKRRTIPGTLHPPLAAAMAQMAEIEPGHTVLDPCCGAGTPLIEAAHIQPQAHLHGFDISPESLRASRTNAAGLAIEFRQGDAGALPLPDAGVDRVICNPPWGTQVAPDGRLSRRWTELRRVLAPKGIAVILTPDPSDLTIAIRNGLIPVHLQQVRIAGTHSSLVQLRHSAD
ncbi:TRM11 family SAM-dependent methyltransferase [Actinomadura sp. 9N407]|uniref:TRM11 family SAM-dependent methyltransferase n=1 Tax=Actinomadura sp. 9N407 TaxID=3375154 RepID=UPI0037B17C6C